MAFLKEDLLRESMVRREDVIWWIPRSFQKHFLVILIDRGIFLMLPNYLYALFKKDCQKHRDTTMKEEY